MLIFALSKVCAGHLAGKDYPLVTGCDRNGTFATEKHVHS